jgi:predicted ester cyclase
MNPTDLVKAFRQELWGGADPTAIDRYVAPDARIVMSGSDGSTIEVMRADVARYFGAFENVWTEIVELVAAGDQVVLWWRTKGTHTGPYGDIAPEPTGLTVTMEGVDFYRVGGNYICEVRSFWDAAAVYRQFGLLADHL